jgi:hypothetical protein
MANKKETTGSAGCTVLTLDSVGQMALGEAIRGAAGGFLLYFKGNGFTGSITIKARPTGSGIADSAALAIPYTKRNLAGVVADDTTVSAAITGDALVSVIADGLDIVLDVTAVSAGSMTVYARPFARA